MHINIIIPTYNRPDLLIKTIHSIKRNSYKDVSIFVVVDGNREILEKVLPEDVAILFNPERRDWVYSINRGIFYAISDAVIYAADDLIFQEDCLERAVRAMEEKFPDGDGLVAIKQSVVGCNTAFGMFGHKFIERFPERCVFCPDYIHYCGDSELGQFARNINCLYVCNEAKVVHHRLKDATYNIAKPVEGKDFHCHRVRRDAGLLWGRDFQLLRKEK